MRIEDIRRAGERAEAESLSWAAAACCAAVVQWRAFPRTSIADSDQNQQRQLKASSSARQGKATLYRP